MVERATPATRAGRATVHLAVAAAMAFGMYLFVTVLLITAIGPSCSGMT